MGFLQLRVLRPGLAVFRYGLEVLRVQGSTSIDLAQCLFEVYVLHVDALLPAHSDGPPEDLSRGLQILPTDV